jgi:hypothetical protein
MRDDIVLWIVLLLSLPLVVIALAPILNPLYRLAGQRFVFKVQGIETRQLTSGPSTQMGVFEVSLRLCNSMGLAINYAYKRISRGHPLAAISVGDEVELFAIAGLARKFGWSPRTTFTHSNSLSDSFGIYLPFWFIGVLPFISSAYFLARGQNLLFDLVGLFGIGT